MYKRQALICFIIDKIPGLQLRVTEEAEARGLDEDQIGEFAYDYVEVRRDYYEWGVDTDNLHSGDDHEQVSMNNNGIGSSGSSSAGIELHEVGGEKAIANTNQEQSA